MELAQWNLPNRICLRESARWNLLDGIYSINLDGVDGHDNQAALAEMTPTAAMTVTPATIATTTRTATTAATATMVTMATTAMMATTAIA